MAPTHVYIRTTPNHPFVGVSAIEEYEVQQKLGEGTFGEVYKARCRADGSAVALKKILRHNEKDGFPVTAVREIKLLKSLSHINVLQLQDMAIERPKNLAKGEKKAAILYMVTPYMEHDLSGLLTNPDVRFSEAQIKCYMLQILEGLRYLHDNHILHRDMKAANLLINNRGILQIADFGLARHYDEPVPQRSRGPGEARRDYTTLVVTRWYRPPELLLQLRRYTTAVDMWGAGCVFAEMFKGRPILPGKSDLDQINIIFDLVGSPTEENMPGWNTLPGCEGVTKFSERQGKFLQDFRDQSPEMRSLLAKLLTLDWRRRLTAIDALEHRYFKTPPLPARPGDLPSYADSHELDRRGQGGPKEVLPPAPVGGTVGMGTNGEWSRGPGEGYYSRPPSRQDYRGPPVRAPTGPSNLRGGSYQDHRTPDGWRPPHNTEPARRSNLAPPPAHHDLPARPPPTSDRERDHDHPARENSTRPVPTRNKDTYIPTYADSRDRDRDRRHPRDDRDRDRDYRDRGEYYERRRDRDYDDRRQDPLSYDDNERSRVSAKDRESQPRRTRSRSPERDREREKRDRELLSRR